LLGKSLYGIKQELERLNLETPMHKKVWHSTDKYRRVIYRCNKKYSGKKCSTGHVTEDDIKEKFLEAYNSLDRNGAIRNVESIKQVLMSSNKEKAEQKKLQDEYDKCEKKLYKLIEENSTHAQNQDEYNKKYRDLADKSTKIQEKLDKITAVLKDKGDGVKVLETYINDLKASKNKLTCFDEGLFYALVDRVKVNKGSIKIIWKDGTES